MWRLVVRRLLTAIPTLLTVSIVVFLIVHRIPGDPISVQLAKQPDPVIHARLESFYGLDRPLPVQYVDWLLNVLHGDFGVSIASGRSVFDTVIERLPRTLALMAGGMFVSLVDRHPRRPDRRGTGGHVARSRRDDRCAGAHVTAGVLARHHAGAWSFSVKLGWFPTGGYVAPSDGARRLRPPPRAPLARPSAQHCAGSPPARSRAGMADAMRQDYVVLAAGPVVTRSRIVWRHATRNALVPTITLVGLQVGYLLGGAHHLREGLLLPRPRGCSRSKRSTSRLPVIQGLVAAVRGHVHHRQPGGRPLRDLPRTTTAPTGDQGRVGARAGHPIAVHEAA